MLQKLIVISYDLYSINYYKTIKKAFIIAHSMNLNDNTEKKFGAKLAYIRKSKKLSQMKLAEIVDMNFNYIGQIERGEANVTIKTMIVLANALNVELKTLFDFTF